MTDRRERFMAKVVPEALTGCWLWQGAITPQGYGEFWDNGMRRAHIVSYELFVGPVPERRVLDHSRARGCATRACVNPDHLEPVPVEVNTARGDSPAAMHARKTHCKRGHDLALARKSKRGDGRTFRQCVACERDRRVRRARFERANTEA